MPPLYYWSNPKNRCIFAVLNTDTEKTPENQEAESEEEK